MRLAFVSIPHYACAVEISRRPDLHGRLLVIGDGEQPNRVLDCSPEARAQRVRPGVTVRDALAKCPDAVVIPPDLVLYRNLWRHVLDALGGVSPEIEDEEPGRAYLNVAGLQMHYRDEAAMADEILAVIRRDSGLEATMGIATSKFIACAAAATQPSGKACVVQAGDEANFIAPLSIGLLPVEPEVIRRLRLLGLNHIGDIARLSLPELQVQFGFAGKRLWYLSNGVDHDPLRPLVRVERLMSSLRFEAPVAGIDVMVACARELLSRLRPAMNGRSAREMTLEAELTSGRSWERRLIFREAVSESARLLFLLRSTLLNTPPPMAVHSLSLDIAGLTGETGRQLYLGEKIRLQRQLEESISQLKARYGYSPIFRCLEVESWSVIPEERQILVEFDG